MMDKADNVPMQDLVGKIRCYFCKATWNGERRAVDGAAFCFECSGVIFQHILEGDVVWENIIKGKQ